MLGERAGDLVEVDGRLLIKTRPGMNGHAVFGPYSALEKGKYRVEFYMKPLDPLDGERDPLIAVADVTAGVVVTLFDAMVFRSHLESDDRYVAYFETDRPLSGVEYRLYVNGTVPLLIGDDPQLFAVEHVGPWPQPTSPLTILGEHADRVRSLFFSGSTLR